MPGEFEFFDHTADLGVRVRATSLAELARTAVDAFYATIGTLEVAGPGPARALEFRGDDPAVLLRDLLAELLTLFESERRKLTEAVVDVFEPPRLVVRGAACAIDAPRCEFRREVKAVTYHELELRPVADGFEFVFIVDI